MSKQQKLKKYYIGNRSEMIDFLPLNYNKVLEVGCGDGSFRVNLIADCEYWGVEPADVETSLAETTNTKILKGYFEDVYSDLPDNYFDLIICNDVIEHVPDHDVFLSSLKRKMKKKSVVVGSIPNVRYYDNLYHVLHQKNWMYQDSGILDRTHLRFFTEKSLQETFLNNKFSIENFSGINNVLDRTRSLRKLFKYYYLIFILFFIGGSNSDIKFQQFAFRINIDD